MAGRFKVDRREKTCLYRELANEGIGKIAGCELDVEGREEQESSRWIGWFSVQNKLNIMRILLSSSKYYHYPSFK
jgi:hypothetical protein